MEEHAPTAPTYETTYDAPGQDPLLPQVAILSVTLLILIQQVSLSRSLWSAIKHLFGLPMTVLAVLGSLLKVLWTALSLLGHTIAILRALITLGLIAAIVMRLYTLLRRLTF